MVNAIGIPVKLDTGYKNSYAPLNYTSYHDLTLWTEILNIQRVMKCCWILYFHRLKQRP